MCTGGPARASPASASRSNRRIGYVAYSSIGVVGSRPRVHEQHREYSTFCFSRLLSGPYRIFRVRSQRAQTHEKPLLRDHAQRASCSLHSYEERSGRIERGNPNGSRTGHCSPAPVCGYGRAFRAPAARRAGRSSANMCAVFGVKLLEGGGGGIR